MNDPVTAAAKVHPATREVLPDDPMEMIGVNISGDPMLMLRLLVEEYSRVGWGVDDIVALARDPNYIAFHRFWIHFGERELRRRVAEIASRTGVMRVRVQETVPMSERLVQIEGVTERN